MTTLHICIRGFIVLLVASFALPGNVRGDILSTKHNLSISGPGDIRARKEDRVCVFCHTPHNAASVTPLWNRPLSGAVYNLYASTTLKSKPGQPTGTSRLCLSCHDGTIALGMILGLQDPIPFVGGVTTLPPYRKSNLTTDLSDDHPISFAYSSTLAAQNGQLNDPAMLPAKVKLQNGNLECTACHNPHDNINGKFLVMSNLNSALCVACHNVTGWKDSTHATHYLLSARGCDNCHISHNAPGPARLLKRPAMVEEQNCLACHNESGGGSDLQSQFNKMYKHPLDYAGGVHDEKEDPLAMAKHVECVDCHNSHRVNSKTASPPLVSGKLTGVRGVNVFGTVVEESAYEYEICYKCHADNSMVTVKALSVARQFQDFNERLRFDPVNPSYHPVVQVGKGRTVPSLRSPYLISSKIYCSDCHNSDDSKKANGFAPNGPHGSIYPHILVARYEQDAYALNFNPSDYALCFRCHDDNVLLDPLNPGRSAFPKHYFHVVQKLVPCSFCHDPHGVPFGMLTGGNSGQHLINFDTRFVGPTPPPTYSGRSCTVSCHPSNPKTY